MRIELALGNLPRRTQFLWDFDHLPQAIRATDMEVAALIETERLFARGIGYCDAHLLAAARLSGATMLWTRDGRLREVAESLDVAAPLN